MDNIFKLNMVAYSHDSRQLFECFPMFTAVLAMSPLV